MLSYVVPPDLKAIHASNFIVPSGCKQLCHSTQMYLLGGYLVNTFRINQPSKPDYKIKLFHKPENPSSTIRAKVMNVLKASLLGTISFATMHYNKRADAQHRITLR